GSKYLLMDIFRASHGSMISTRRIHSSRLSYHASYTVNGLRVMTYLGSWENILSDWSALHSLGVMDRWGVRSIGPLRVQSGDLISLEDTTGNLRLMPVSAAARLIASTI